MSKVPLAYADGYFADIGAHKMPMKKFGLVRDAILGDAQLAAAVTIAAPAPASDEDLLRVHTPEYVRAVATGEPRELAESQKFPWSPALAGAVRLTSGGCIAALAAALDGGLAGNLASGFHHAHADHGEGFCTFHGLVVAFERLRVERPSFRRLLVIDLDLHYGNGTVSFARTRPDLFNLSIYGNWYRANTASRDVDTVKDRDTANAWSVAVPNGASGDAYVATVRAHVGPAIVRARPDAIFYQAGADPYREDPYSPLLADTHDLYERDKVVFEAARAAGVPIAYVLAGGYTPDVSKVVLVHVNTLRAALTAFRPPAEPGSPPT
jgi:acetoin utilization deacetylase AcuC-like enzyme